MSKELARKLRRNASYAEQDFWRLTWTWRQAGWPFRRQQLIGTYYVDFACMKAALVIEIDGDTHGSDLAQSNDAARDDYLRSRGFTVMRFSNSDVSSSPDGVFDVVAAYLESRAATPPPQPSPRGGGSSAGFGTASRQDHQIDFLPLAGRVGVGEATRSNTDEDHE